MRAYRSYLSLMARSTLYKELLLFVGMAAVELALFLTEMQGRINQVATIISEWEDARASQLLLLYEVVKGSHLIWVWFASLLLLSFILIRTAGQWRDYTLDRLGLSRKQGNLLYGIYCTLSFVLLWAFQAGLCVAICLLYRQNLPAEQVTSQTVLLSIYRTPLFFTMLPLANGVRWVTNGMLMAALGFCAANGARLRRLGRYPVASVCMIVGVFLFGYGSVGVSELSPDMGYISVAFCFGAAAIARMTIWDTDEEGENGTLEQEV